MKKFTGILPFLFIPFTVFSQQVDGLSTDPPVQDVINMEEIVVTATRTPRMLKDVPVITRVISSAAIEKSGVSTIHDLLSTEVAGVEFNQAGYGTTISFQGLDARYVLFLVDGERLAGETYGNIDFLRIPLENIERIEIIKGASSVLYGSNAMGAVINIITKNPPKKTEAGGSFRYAGFNDRDRIAKIAGTDVSPAMRENAGKYRRKMDVPNMAADAYMGFRAGKLRSLTELGYQGMDAYMMKGRAFQSRIYKDGATMMDFTQGRPVTTTLPSGYVFVDSTLSSLSISGWQTFHVRQKLNYQFSEKVTANLSAGYYWKNRYDFWGTDGGIPMQSVNSNEPWTFEHYSSCDLDAAVDYAINQRNHITFSTRADIYRRGNDSLGTLIPKQRHGFLIPRVLWVNTPDRINRITAGLEYSREFLNLDLTPEGYGDLKTYNIFSIYAQDEIAAARNLGIVAGLRLDSWGFKDASEAITNFIGKIGRAQHKDRGLTATPKLAFTYRLNDFTFRANYARGFRTPSLKELYMEYYQPTMAKTILGNPELKPEKNDYISLSAEYTVPVLNTSVNGYASFFRNKIDVYQQDNNILKYFNTAKSRYYGVEWMGRLRLLRGWWVKANYNFVYEKRAESSSDRMTQYIYTSPHTAVIQTDYTFHAKRFEVNLNIAGRYIGKKEYEDHIPFIRYKEGTTDQVAKIINGVTTIKLPDYTMWNIAANIQYDRRYTLTLGIDNLFDYTPAIVSFNTPATPGRLLFARISFRY